MMKKRIISFLVAAVMLLQIAPVFAAQVITEEKMWKQTFDGLSENTAPDEMILASLPANYEGAQTLGEAERNIAKTAGVYAAMGKSASDSALEVSTEYASDTLPTISPDTAVYSGPTLKNNAGSDDKSAIFSGVTTLAETDILHISFEYAINNYAVARKVKMRSRPSTKNVADTQNMFLVFGTDATVKLFGSSVADFAMPLNKWVKFDFVIKNPQLSTGSTVDMYADGVKLVSDMVFDGKSGKTNGTNGVIDPFKGLGTVMFYFPMGAADGVYPLTQTYLDNYLIEVLSAEPEIGTFSMTHSNPSVNGGIDNTKRSVVAPSSITVSQFKDGLDDANVVFTATDGSELADSDYLTDGFIRATDSAGTNIYYTVETFEKNFYINENFDGKTITEQNDVEENTVFTVENNIADTATAIYTTEGLSGRDETDTSVVMEVSEFTAESDSETANTVSLNYSEVITESFVFESSVMVSEDVGAYINMNLSDTGVSEVVRFGSDGKIYVNSADSGNVYIKNGFYKTAVAYDSENSLYSVYINGIKCGGDISAAEGISSVSIGMSAEKDGSVHSGSVALDDIKMYSGEYVSGADTVEVASASEDIIVYEDDIYVLTGETLEGLDEKLVLNNAALKGVYTSAALTQTAEFSDGCVLLFENLAGGVLVRYNVTELDDTLPVIDSKYEFDNENEYIYVPVKTTAENIVSGVTLHAGHSAAVTDANGETLPGDTVIELDDEVYLRITYKDFTSDYRILTSYFNENFDSLFGEKLSQSGLMCNQLQFTTTSLAASETVVYVEGTELEGEKAAKVYTNVSSPASDAKITLRAGGVPAERTKAPFVLTWDFNTSNISGLNSIVFKYTRKSGEENSYYNLIDFQGGNIKLGGSIIGTYKANEWTRLIVLMSQSGGVKVFVNGKQLYNHTLNFFQKLADHIDDIIFTHGATKGERITYMDNMGFYPITDIAKFDSAPMNSTVTSDYEITGSDNVISNYGYGSIEELLKVITIPEGAEYAFYGTDGNEISDYTLAADTGMELVITSPNGMYQTKYTLGEHISVDAQLLIAERALSYLIEGEAKAKAEIKSALPYGVKLILSYTNANDPSLDNEITVEQTVEGSSVIETEAVATVKNEEGEELSMRLVEAESGEDITEPVLVKYTGQLDLSSEITPVKYGHTSIVTLTMDDGVQGGVTKYNNWFKQYGLRGTAMIWATRLQENSSFYQSVFADGYIDLGSHSKTHVDLTSGSVTDEIRNAEVVESQSIMKNLFPGQQVITYAPAENRLDDASEVLARQTYWAMRQGKRGYNSLDPADDGIGGWYDLKIQGIHNPVDESGVTCGINDMLDIAASKPMWLIEMFHGVDSGYGAVTTTDAQSHFSYISQLQNEGKLWCASFAEATKYIRERQNTVIEDVATENSRTIKLTMTGLPEDIFNYPLTVKSEVPADWIYAKVTQDGSVQAPEIKVEDGRCYIYYDANPTGGEITVENVSELPQVTIKELKINTSGSLTQSAGSVANLTVNATVSPADNVDDSGLKWYVNGSMVQAGQLSYEFNFQAAGEYEIVLKDAVTGLVSNSITVTVKLPGILFEEDFEGYKGQTTVPGSALYSNATVNLYDDNEDLKAEFFYDSAALYPAFHKTVDYTLTKPVIYNGNVKLVNDGSKKQTFYLEMRNSADGSSGNRKTIFNVSGGSVYDVNGTEIAKIADGNTLNFSIGILAAAEGEAATFKYALSGSELYDVNGENKGKVVMHETTAVIDNIAVFTNNKANMLFNNNFSKANESAKTYLDDVRIYNPDIVLMYANDADMQTVKFDLTADVYNVDASKITVTSSLNETVVVKNAYINPDNPYELVCEFESGVLTEGETYTVTLNDAAFNAWQTAVSCSGEFTALQQSGEELSYVEVNAVDGTIFNIGDNVSWGNLKKDKYEKGKVLKLRAVADANTTFMYWKDKNSGKILSYEADYEFTVGTGKKIAAIFTDDSNVYMSFININGIVVAEGYADSAITVPENPYISGYSFSGWYVGDEKQSFKAGDAPSGFSENVKFRAGYTLDETLYEITADGANEQGGKYKYNTKLTFSVALDNFIYWTRDGKIVSYDKEYSFYVSGNSSVSAVYGSEVEKLPVIVMSEPQIIAGGKISFYAERNVSAEYRILENGILMSDSENVSLESFTYKATATNNSNTGQYTVRKANVSSGEVWYAAAYMIYADESGNIHTVYSNEVSKQMS